MPPYPLSKFKHQQGGDTLPERPKKPCNYPGCSALVPGGERHCEAHRKQIHRTYDRNRRDPDLYKFYGSVVWQRLREYKKTRDPLCEECLNKGKVVPVEHVHHKIPAGRDPSKRLDIDNLISLCEMCHKRLHAFGKYKE